MAEQGARVLWALDYLRNYGRTPADFLAEGFEVHRTGPTGETDGVFAGNDALRAVLSELAADFDGLALETDEPEEQSDGTVAMVVYLVGHDRESGTEVERAISWLWTFEGEAATKLQVFEDPDGALGA
jgi:ketosteroid isomerase-like protein